MDTKQLEQLGLTKNESKVYNALVLQGSTNADPIIKKTGLHRNIVYDNLGRLIDKGLATFVLKAKRRYFEATPTHQLSRWIEEQKKNILGKEMLAKTLIPEIEANRKLSQEYQEVAVFKGIKGLMTAIEEIPKSKGEILILGTGGGMKETLGYYYYPWHTKLKSAKARTQLLLSIKAKDDKKHPIKARFIPESYKIPVTSFIYSGKVLILVWDEEPLAIQIRSAKVYESYKNYFDVLWKISVE